MAQITAFGKTIKRRLIDVEKQQAWLIDRVRCDTGLYFDGSYLYKVMTGQLSSCKIVNSICSILNIPAPTDANACLEKSMQPEEEKS